MVKADAYGLGAGAIAPRLHREGCRSFFTATASEGAALRGALGSMPADIYVLHGYWSAERPMLEAARLRPVLNDAGQIDALRRDGALACALHLDTGMNRLGLTPADAQAAIGDPAALRALGVDLVMSHLACADDPAHPMNARQRDAFAALAARTGLRLSLASTGGVLLGSDYHFDMTRPGIGLYGGDPAGSPPSRFAPVVRIEAPVLQTRRVKAGETVGYSAAYTAPRDMTTATVSLGYADGFLRASGNGGFARIGAQKAPVIGRVSMDLIVLDVTGLEEQLSQGAPVEFLGADLDAVAVAGGSMGYELLTRLGARFDRIYEGRP